jgi:tetratricopeptide (TPR) repeat protein
MRVALWSGLAALLFSCAAAAADTTPLPPPAARYVDEDPAATAIVLVNPSRSDVMQRLDQLVREPKNAWKARAQRGFLYGIRGEREKLDRDYSAAAEKLPDDPYAPRILAWQHGWALFEAGDYAAALARWQEAERAHGGHPSWVPYTFAVALWRMDRREEALAYYAAAVRSAPERWGSKAGLASITTKWHKPELEAAEALLEAWTASGGT